MLPAPAVAGTTKAQFTRTRPRASGTARCLSATAPTWRRHKVSGRTRAEVVRKLKELQAEKDSGVQPEHAYTVERAADDWLAEGLDGRSGGMVRLNHDVSQLITTV